MSKDAKQEGEAPAAAAEAGPAKPSLITGPFILALLNTLAGIAVIGAIAYTRIIYKRPAITEETERQRIEAENAKPKKIAQRAVVNLDALTANIASSAPKAAEGDRQVASVGKLHYLNLGLSIELRDSDDQDLLEVNKAKLVDRVLSIVGRKEYPELTTVQGRYVLKSQIIKTANELMMVKPTPGRPEPEPVVTNVYFTQFVVQ